MRYFVSLKRPLASCSELILVPRSNVFKHRSLQRSRAFTNSTDLNPQLHTRKLLYTVSSSTIVRRKQIMPTDYPYFMVRRIDSAKKYAGRWVDQYSAVEDARVEDLSNAAVNSILFVLKTEGRDATRIRDLKVAGVIIHSLTFVFHA
jgi:hypothetical protein